jgi:hypothetical protein
MTVIELLVVFLIIAMVVFFPFAFIWALNALFSLAIPFTFKTWMATVVLLGATGAFKINYNGKHD